MKIQASSVHRSYSRQPILLILMTIMVALTVQGVGAPAMAQDGVGVYWDTAYSQDSALVTTLPAFTTGYVVAKNPVSAGGYLAWELCVAVDGNADFVSWDVAGTGVNFESPPCFVVGYSEPILPTGDGLLLATFEMLVTDVQPVAISLTPTRTPSLPGQMAFVPADSPEDLLPLIPVTGTPEVAWINRDTPWPELTPSSLFFDTQPVGSQTFKTFTITNVGGGSLNLDIALSQNCVGFALTGIQGPLALTAGESAVIEVAFLPPDDFGYACNVELGPNLPMVDVHGTGRALTFSYTVSPLRDFGEIGIGGSKNLTATLTNTGEIPIPVAPHLLGCGNDFSIVAGANPVTVPPSSSYSVTIQFHPQTTGTLTCALMFADDLGMVNLQGVGTDPLLSFLVQPTAVDFGSSQVGAFIDRSVKIINTGDITFTITPGLSTCGNSFTIISGQDPIDLASGQEHSVVVRFQPENTGPVGCILMLGQIVPAVQLAGLGTVAVPTWTVTPAEVEFPVTPMGTTSIEWVRIDNTGRVAIGLDVQLFDPNLGFSILSGGGLVEVLPDSAHVVLLEFDPVFPGLAANELRLGSLVPAVPMFGFSGDIVDSCEVSVSSLDFGSVLVGRLAQRTFSITNTGNRTMTANPTTSSRYYAVTGGPVDLEPGQSALFAVTFSPGQAGSWPGVIDTGNTQCAVVLCTGIGTAPPPGTNEVGIFFDTAFTINRGIVDPFTPAVGYVVLTNPSDPTGVSAWECAINVIGEGTVLDWRLEGAAVNFAVPPQFIVGIGPTPLPGSSAVLLASFDFMVNDPNAVIFFEMVPVFTPSLPGEMAWIAGVDSGLLPMGTTTGEPIVAVVNDGGTVGIEVPSPRLTLTGGQVHLSWPAPVEPGSGSHVYRRVAGRDAERLTSVPLTAGMGTLEFLDQPVGFAPGSTLYYSYAVVIDGVEKARSPEVEVTLAAVPMSLTRLLSNVPNPFNPQTEIRFELSEPSEVRVAIYDVTGRRVKVLENSHLNAGPHSRVWQGRDSSGRPVSSGAYYVRLETKGKVDYQKILLLK